MVTPESAMEPGGEGLHQPVSSVVWGSIQVDDLSLFLALCSTVEPSDSSIVKLFDETGKLLCSVIQGDGEVGELLLVLFISRWTLCKAIVFIVHPLFKYFQLHFEALDLLPMDIVSDSDGVSKSSNDRAELVRGWIGGGCEDVLHRGGREGETPRVSGGESNPCNVFSDLANPKGIMFPKAKVA